MHFIGAKQLNSETTTPSQSFTVAMTSGSQHCVTEVFLHEETQLREAHALRIAASKNLGGVSTGIGFLGSPEWALGGAAVLGILEGIAGNVAAKKGLSQVDESNRLLAAAQTDGVFVPVRDIQNISVPKPSLWKGIMKQTASKSGSLLKAYIHSGEPFVLARTLEGDIIYLMWEKIEAFLPPPMLKIGNVEPIEEQSDTQLMEQFGITFDGKQYHYGIYRYDRLDNAIRFAKSERSRL